MDQDNLTDQLSCPCCSRDYELPRRYLIHLDDYDFTPIPRLLPCLHSMCHSCLQEQFEKNNYQFIECNLCHYKDVIKGVNFLPLDLTILKQIVNTNSTELLATCAKCYDVVPSVSWCETCSSALCEFHHQDHKLSVETSKHAFHTFKEYFYQNKHIEYRFPPISCPECILQDCEYYCFHCYHLISSKSFIEHHKTHEIQSTDDVYPKMKQNVEHSVKTSKEKIHLLNHKISKIKEFLNQLDENEENYLINISKQFNLIYSHLKNREKELISNFTNVISDERKKLLTQLSNLVEIMEDYQQVGRVGGQFLSFANTSSSPQKQSNDHEQAVGANSSQKRKKSQNIYENIHEPMYLIAASDTIEDRCDYLQKQLEEKLQLFNDHIIPMYSVDFQSQDINMIHGTINCLGAMSPYPYLAERKELIPPNPNALLPEKEKEEDKKTDDESNMKGLHEENFGSIHFSINLGDDSGNSNSNNNPNHRKNNPNLHSKESLHLSPSRSKAGLEPGKEQRHSLFIETRWIPPKSYPLPLIPDQHDLKGNQSPRSLKPHPPHSPRSPTTHSPERKVQPPKEPETETLQHQANGDGPPKIKPSNEADETVAHASSSYQSIIEMYNKIFSEGILLGKIEINEKVIKKLNERLRYKTYFESRKQDNSLNHHKSSEALKVLPQASPALQPSIHFESKTISYLSITKELSIE